MRNRYAKIALDTLLPLTFLALVFINMITMPVCGGLVTIALSTGNFLAALVAFGIGWACAVLLLIVAAASSDRRRAVDGTSATPHPIAS